MLKSGLLVVVLMVGAGLGMGCNDRSVSDPSPAGPATGPTGASAEKGALPAGHPPVAGQGMAALPAGHPALPTTQQSGLPAGHPAIPSTQPSGLPAGHPMIQGNQAVIDLPTPETGAKLAWTLPTGWTEQRTGGIRYATLSSPADRKLDVAVTTFPGTVGGTLANINRWRQQVGVPVIEEKDLEKNITRVKAGEVEVIVTDIVGPEQRMLAAIVPDKDQTWFLKMGGGKDVVEKNKGEFMELVKSLKVGANQ